MLLVLLHTALLTACAAGPDVADPATVPAAPASTTPAAQPTAPEPDRTGACLASVAELPDSPLFAREDPRLQGGALIVVSKEQRRLQLFSKGAVVVLDDRPACWPVGLAAGYVEGHKQRQGDLRTPEGWYRTSDKPSSSFYHAIAVHYPEVADAERGLRQGLITAGQRDAIVGALRRGQKPLQDTRLGGEILIHGGGSDIDWTLGCVALEDGHIDALRSRLPAGMATEVLILP